MAKTRLQKEQAVQSLVDGLQGATSVVFANYQGVPVADMEALRAKCREAGVTCIASKKTLVGTALKNAGLDIDTKSFQGGVAAFFGSDEVSAPKVVADFAKDHELVTIFGGVLEGKHVDIAQVKALAALPNREQLLAQLVGTLNAPISGFVNVLAGNLRGFVNVLNAVKEQKA